MNIHIVTVSKAPRWVKVQVVGEFHSWNNGKIKSVNGYALTYFTDGCDEEDNRRVCTVTYALFFTNTWLRFSEKYCKNDVQLCLANVIGSSSNRGAFYLFRPTSMELSHAPHWCACASKKGWSSCKVIFVPCNINRL